MNFYRTFILSGQIYGSALDLNSAHLTPMTWTNVPASECKFTFFLYFQTNSNQTQLNELHMYIGKFNTTQWFTFIWSCRIFF